MVVDWGFHVDDDSCIIMQCCAGTQKRMCTDNQCAYRTSWLMACVAWHGLACLGMAWLGGKQNIPVVKRHTWSPLQQ